VSHHGQAPKRPMRILTLRSRSKRRMALAMARAQPPRIRPLSMRTCFSRSLTLTSTSQLLNGSTKISKSSSCSPGTKSLSKFPQCFNLRQSPGPPFFRGSDQSMTKCLVAYRGSSLSFASKSLWTKPSSLRSKMLSRQSNYSRMSFS
jgi:hypothetical protein